MKPIKIILIICLLVIIVLLNLWLLAFDFSWYQKEFTKTGAYERFDRPKVIVQTQNLFGYLKGQNQLQTSYYTGREIAHLKDIKNLLTAAKIATIVITIIFILALAWSLKQEGLKQTVKLIFQAGLICFGCYLLKMIFSYLFFNQSFLLFHRLVFTNNFWRLDPATESLIVIFPPELFADLAGRIIIYSMISAGLLTAILTVCWLKLKNKKATQL